MKDIDSIVESAAAYFYSSAGHNMANDTEDNVDLSAGEIVSVLGMILVDVVAVVGNLLVITIIAKTPQLRNLTHGFVLNLCILDLLCAFVVMPISILSTITVNWRLGDAYCKANGFFNAFFAFSSILTLSFISVERYYSIASPMDHAANMTPTKGVILVVYVWLQSGLLALPPLVGLNTYEYNQHRGHCTFVWGHSPTHVAYVVLIGSVCFLLPATILVVTYCNVFRVARQAARQVKPSYTFGSYGATASRGNAGIGASSTVSSMVSGTCLPNGTSSSPRTGSQAHSSSDEQDSYQRRPPQVQNYVGKKRLFSPKSFFNITSSDLKAAKTILFIVLTFLILWTPYFALHLYGVFAGHQRGNTPVWERLTTWVAYSSSAVNPIIYGVLNRQIRQEMADIFQRLWNRFKCYRQPEAALDDAMDPGGAEDFFQFLERTSMFTKSTSVTSGLNTKAENGKDETVRIPGQIPEISEGDPTQ
ncbi:probable G-protein coupled receptor [Acanthaster planci]|uniref:Probable G-protein coupled receptor n=1 Tax=Acanthaster planci TaxID=133434 RepID=A0A8B7XK36_ACAPL|nr:probable G-protein coupled receptor [Acanthaster planci]